MHKKTVIYLKSVLRQPAQSLLLLLLIGLLSAAFTTRTVEYILVQRETARLGAYYRAIGSLQSTNPEEYNYAAGANLIADSKYVALEDRRRSCSAVLHGLYNADIDGRSSDGYEKTPLDFGLHNSDVFVYGEVLTAPSPQKIGEEYEAYQFQFRVDRVEAGYPEYVSEGKKITLYFITGETGEDSALAEVQVGNYYLIKAFYDSDIYNIWDNPGENLIIKPINNSDLWFLPVKPGVQLDLETPELAGLQDELELLRENQSAMVVIGTKDMSAMPLMQQASKTYYLTDGRWLDQEDDRSARKVCVVHQEFANYRGLAVGDTITLTLRDFDLAFGGYILDGEEWKNWREFPTQTESFEIVGLYGVALDSPWGRPSMENTNMYIPDSCMPEGFGADPETMVWAYSFVLKSSQDEAAFLEENREALEELGYTLYFVENHYEKSWASVNPMRQ